MLVLFSNVHDRAHIRSSHDPIAIFSISIIADFRHVYAHCDSYGLFQGPMVQILPYKLVANLEQMGCACSWAPKICKNVSLLWSQVHRLPRHILKMATLRVCLGRQNENLNPTCYTSTSPDQSRKKQLNHTTNLAVALVRARAVLLLDWRCLFRFVDVLAGRTNVESKRNTAMDAKLGRSPTTKLESKVLSVV